MKQPELGKKILELRNSKGLTQEELALQCELNIRTVQRIEAGEVDPRAFTLGLLSKALDYDFLSVDKKNLLVWRILLHLSSFMPVLVFPLLICVMKKDEFPDIKSECKDVINFQLSMYFYLTVPAISILYFLKSFMHKNSIFVLLIIGIILVIEIIVNTIKAGMELDYEYKTAIKFIK